MQVEFLKSFSKDIDKIRIKFIKSNLIKLINLVESVDNIEKIPNIKKLSGHKSAYRIRLADYRIGFFYEHDKVIFARMVHRKDIYKVFP
jgi:mRNA interferase RelE/StbE